MKSIVWWSLIYYEFSKWRLYLEHWEKLSPGVTISTRFILFAAFLTDGWAGLLALNAFTISQKISSLDNRSFSTYNSSSEAFAAAFFALLSAGRDLMRSVWGDNIGLGMNDCCVTKFYVTSLFCVFVSDEIICWFWVTPLLGDFIIDTTFCVAVLLGVFSCDTCVLAEVNPFILISESYSSSSFY